MKRIQKFEMINNPHYDENYKWRIAYSFHDLMEPNHPDFPDRIREACKLSANLIDGGSRYCFSSLVKCCEIEPDAVRDLFRTLFANDGDDLDMRQRKIQQFIDDANTLIARLVSTNAMFMNDQRSAMGFLFLYDPDRHYLYKATEALDIASCIEFYDDWGPGTAFRLDVFYRMCDMLVTEIRNSPELLKTHESRFIARDGSCIEGMHPDNNYHILVFDIIYGAPEFRYNFYQNISFPMITAKARKLQQERMEIAEARQAALFAAQEKAEKLAEAEAYFTSVITVGLHVKHKAFGTGQIISINDQYISVSFPQRNEIKSFVMLQSFTGGFLTADIPGLAEKGEMYRSVAAYSSNIKNALSRARREFDEYKEYLG